MRKAVKLFLAFAAVAVGVVLTANIITTKPVTHGGGQPRLFTAR